MISHDLPFHERGPSVPPDESTALNQERAGQCAKPERAAPIREDSRSLAVPSRDSARQWLWLTHVNQRRDRQEAGPKGLKGLANRPGGRGCVPETAARGRRPPGLELMPKVTDSASGTCESRPPAQGRRGSDLSSPIAHGARRPGSFRPVRAELGKPTARGAVG